MTRVVAHAAGMRGGENRSGLSSDSGGDLQWWQWLVVPWWGKLLPSSAEQAAGVCDGDHRSILTGDICSCDGC